MIITITLTGPVRSQKRAALCGILHHLNTHYDTDLLLRSSEEHNTVTVQYSLTPKEPAESVGLSKQIDGNHYLSLKIQPWEYIDANNLGFYEGCVLKYITRKKGKRVTDLKKAIHCLEHLIELEQAGESYVEEV